MFGEAIELGATVVLKTGGPGMTVTEITDNLIKCSWFDQEMQLLYATFPKQALKIQSP